MRRITYMSAKPRSIISFELPPEVQHALEEDTDFHGSPSCHQRAREILIEHFANRERGELLERFGELEREVAYLGELVCRGTYSGMVHGAKLPSRDANDWIRQHMPRTKER